MFLKILTRKTKRRMMTKSPPKIPKMIVCSVSVRFVELVVVEPATARKM